MLVIFMIKFRKKKKQNTKQDKLDPFLQVAVVSPTGELQFGGESTTVAESIQRGIYTEETSELVQFT